MRLLPEQMICQGLTGVSPAVTATSQQMAQSPQPAISMPTPAHWQPAKQPAICLIPMQLPLILAALQQPIHLVQPPQPAISAAQPSTSPMQQPLPQPVQQQDLVL